MVGADVCQFLGGAGSVQGGSDPRVGLVDHAQPPLQPAVAFLLVRRDGLLRGAIDVLETHRAQCDRCRVDQLRGVGETACLLVEQMNKTSLDQPIDA